VQRALVVATAVDSYLSRGQRSMTCLGRRTLAGRESKRPTETCGRRRAAGSFCNWAKPSWELGRRALSTVHPCCCRRLGFQTLARRSLLRFDLPFDRAQQTRSFPRHVFSDISGLLDRGRPEARTVLGNCSIEALSARVSVRSPEKRAKFLTTGSCLFNRICTRSEPDSRRVKPIGSFSAAIR
jgi:hypothetical protein